MATGVPVGAVGGGEARTVVLSGHQWARHFALAAFGARFAGGMLGRTQQCDACRKRASFAACQFPRELADTCRKKALFSFCSCNYEGNCRTGESKVAKWVCQICMQF